MTTPGVMTARAKVPKITGKSEPIYAPGGTVPLSPDLVRQHFKAEAASRRPAVRAPAKAQREAATRCSCCPMRITRTRTRPR